MKSGRSYKEKRQFFLQNHAPIMGWEIFIWPADGFDEYVSSPSSEKAHVALAMVAAKELSVEPDLVGAPP